MKRVFVDSGVFLAHLVAKDSNHEKARALFLQAVQEGWRFVITNAILYETHALILNKSRNGRAVALEFLKSVEENLCRVERVRPEDETRATDLLKSYADKDFSLCDALSFVVMDRLSIHEAISFDQHFREYGRLILL